MNLTNQATLLPELTGDITFKNVYFQYKGRKTYAIKNLNLKINAENSHAFVGGSGSGKSTIFQLLLRFYDVTKGEILFNKYDIKSIDLKHLRSKFGNVRQDPSLFNGTIEYNIKYDK